MSAVSPVGTHQPLPIPRQLSSLGAGVYFFWRVVRGVLGGRVVRRYLPEALRQASILITGSSLIIIALVLTFGLTDGILAAYASRQVGAPSAAGAFTAIGMLREIGPYAFGYMMAAKVSTGYVAELGTMRITDEIDALDVLGLDSVTYLCSTRLLATWLVLPFLYAIAIAVGFAASYFSVVTQIGQASGGGYLELFWKFQSPTDFLFSGIKAMAMGTFVVLVGCYYGYKVRGGPAQVGRATAQAMIVNLIGITIIGIIGTQLFWGTNDHLPIGG